MSEDTLTRIPMIRVWDFVLVVLQGDITDAQASTLTDEILQAIRREAQAALVVDMSGMWLVDSHLCSVIAHLARSAEMMGTKTILAGIRPDVALTLLAMDVEFGELHTTSTLEQALEGLGVRRGSATEAPSAAAPADEPLLPLLTHSEAAP